MSSDPTSESGNVEATGDATGAGAVRSWHWFWPILLLICAAGGTARFFILAEHLANNPFSQYLRVDAQTYWNWAGRIASGQWREVTPFFSAPLYPYLLGLIRAFGGEAATVYVVQILFDLLTAMLLALIGRARFGADVGLLAAALFLTLLEPASFCLRILTCSLQLLLVCLAWLGLLAVQKRDSFWRRVLAGAGVGLLSLAYPPAMLMVPAVGVWLWWRTQRRLRDLGRALVAVIAGAVVIMPATLHNYWACGELFFIQAASGITLRQGNGPGATGGIVMIPGTATDRETLFLTARRSVEAAKGRPVTWSEVDHYYRDEAMAYWRADLPRAIKLFARKAYFFLTGRNYYEIFNPRLEIAEGLIGRLRLAPLQTAWLVPVALIAVAVWLRRYRQYVPELLLFAVPLLVTIVFRYSPRYRLPAVPVIAVGAAWAVSQALHWRKRPGWFISVAAAVLVTVLLSFANRSTGFDSLAVCQPEFEHSLGVCRGAEGRLKEAARHFRKALELKPELDESELSLADTLRKLGWPDEAMEHARRVLARNPQSARAHSFLGILLVEQKQLDQAVEQFRYAIQLDRNLADAHTNLGNVLSAQGKFEESIEPYRAALQVRPNDPAVLLRLGAIYAHLGQNAAAEEAFQSVLRIDPRQTPARMELAYLFLRQQKYADAVAVFRQGCLIDPTNTAMANDLAWVLATCPQDEVRDGQEALRLATQVRAASPAPAANVFDTLAAAYAEVGQFDQAVEAAHQAVELAEAEQNAELAEKLRGRLSLYESHQPYHDRAE